MLLGVFLVLVLAAGLRQLVSIREKIRLADDLEDRIEVRTADLYAERELLRAIVENLHDGVAACDSQGRLTFLNTATEDLLQQKARPGSPADWPVTYGVRCAATLALVRADEVPLLRALRGEVVVDRELVIRPCDGRDRYVSVSGRALRGADGTVVGAVVTLHDITETRQARMTLQCRALQDELTGLANRAHLNDALELAVARPRPHGSQLAVLLLDIDDFKKVNDSLGHQAGDALLVVVADRFRTMLRAGDLAARIGGDEFVLMLQDTTEDEARSVANRLLTALDSPILVHGSEVVVTASVGVALSRDSQVADLLVAADQAMYVAKRRGKAGIEVFEPRMRIEALERLGLERDLRLAVAQQQMHLVYQPIVNLDTGTMTGVEALLRWRHGQRGMVSPVDFIPVAEDTGLILALGEWVLNEAVAQLTRWRARFPDLELSVSVNVSTRQLERGGLLSTLDDLISAGLTPADLVLEITETALGLDDGASARMLRSIRDRGIALAVDDFGTGYSSLGRLRTAPVSTLKIDRSFVNEITDSASAVPIVDATIAMAQGLALGVIAEGIETPAQLAYLTRIGCPRAQGYLLARPMDAAGVERILAGDSPWTGLFSG